MIRKGQRIGRLVYCGIREMEIKGFGPIKAYIFLDSMDYGRPVFIADGKSQLIPEEKVIEMVKRHFPDFSQN